MKPIIKSMIGNIRKQKTTNQNNKKKKESKKNEDSISSLWDNFKRSNIYIIGVPEGEDKEHEIGNLSEKIVKETFPNFVKEIDMQVQEAQRVPNKMDAKRPMPRHIIIKRSKFKDKERILKASGEKQLVTCRGVPLRLSAEFSKETLQARKDWQEIFKDMKIRELQPRLLYPAKLSFRIEGQIKSFPDKKKLNEYIITKPLLYEMLKELI